MNKILALILLGSASSFGILTANAAEIPVLSKISISPTIATLSIGGAKQQLTATRLDQFGNLIATKTKITWSSSNTGVATVNSKGQVKPISAGKTNIIASSFGVYSAPTVVTVAGAQTPSSIQISPTTANLGTNGASKQLTATTLDQEGNPMTAKISWKSSNTLVASVSSTGLVTTGIAGTANITASYGAIISTPAIITVSAIVPVSGYYPFPYQSNPYNSSEFLVTTRTDGKSFVTFYPQNYTGYTMPIINGKFSYQNGIVNGSRGDNGNLYPTDGFKISGQFNTERSATGVISYVYNGQVRSKYNFSISI